MNLQPARAARLLAHLGAAERDAGMARLFEYQGKKLLSESKIAVPKGEVCETARAVSEAAGRLGGEVVIKAQVWSTKRASWGGIRFAGSPEEAGKIAEQTLTQFGNELGAERERIAVGADARGVAVGLVQQRL